MTIPTNDPNAKDNDEMETCYDCGWDYYPEELEDGRCGDCQQAYEDDYGNEVTEDGE